MNKKINFYKYQIIIEKDGDLSFLDILENSNIEPTVINEEVIKVDDFKKFKSSDRFHGLYFQSGDLFNYSLNIVDTKDSLKKKKNPRKSTDIELNKQFFFLIDRKNKFIYLSDNKQQVYIKNWIKDKGVGTVILDEEKLLKTLKHISEINFVFKNENMLFKNSPLDIALMDDLFNYEADSINIGFKYNKQITQNIKDKISYLFGEKDKYNNIQIKGRSDKNIDLLFNSNGIMSRIPLNEELDEKTKKYDPKSVFDNLIAKIKIYEKK